MPGELVFRYVALMRDDALLYAFASLLVSPQPPTYIFCDGVNKRAINSLRWCCFFCLSSLLLRRFSQQTPTNSPILPFFYVIIGPLRPRTQIRATAILPLSVLSEFAGNLFAGPASGAYRNLSTKCFNGLW